MVIFIILILRKKSEHISLGSVEILSQFSYVYTYLQMTQVEFVQKI